MKRFLLALLVAALPFTVQADDPAKPKQGTYVVMVGVGSFEDKAIQPRPSAVADAKALYDLFTDSKYSDVPKDRAVLLTSGDAGTKATRENIIKAIHDAVAATSKDDLIVIGLFGRAAPVGDQTGFFAVDSTVKDRGKNAVLGSDLGTELKPAKGQKILLIVDESFKGFDAGKETLIEPTLRDLFSAVFGGGEDRDEEQMVNDKLVILSTTPSHEPLGKGDHGLLATSLLTALKGKADTEGGEPDGLVTADELAKWLDKETADEVRTTGKNTKEKEAVPFVVGEATSHFAIAKNPAITPTVEKRKAALEALAKANTINKEVLEEGTGLVSRMPKLKALQGLRKDYEKLADGTMTPAEFTTARAAVKEAMKLSTGDAAEFAKKTHMGIEALRVRYVKKLDGGEMTANAIRGLFKRLELPIPTDIEEELKSAKDWDEDKQKEMLTQTRLKLGKREDLDDVKDVDMALLMMTLALNDPYTVYFDKEQVKKAASSLRSEFSGIGIHIRRDLARDGLLCVAPIKGSPAYKAGLKAGDLITEVCREVDAEGKPITDEKDKVISTKGMKMDDALKLILGLPGVPVTVTVEREGEPKPLSFEIKRGRVSLETILGVKRNEKDDWEFWLDEKDKIAYVYMTQFGPRTADELKNVVERMQRFGMKGMILDLRFNPGGMLGAALMISDMFIDDGLCVTVKPRVGREEKYYDQGFGKFTKFPMVVLINGNSASASEIVSACLKDYSRATIIGERSYGKGSVQTIERFRPTEGEFKFTTARYFPPLGENIDKLSTPGKPEDEWGVKPSEGFEVKLSREEKADLAEFFRDKELLKKPEVKEGKGPLVDKQLEMALDTLKKQIAEGYVGTAKK